MEQEQFINIDHVEYQRLLLTQEKAKKHLEKVKARNYEEIMCDLCNIKTTKGNVYRHNLSVTHRNKVAIQKLNSIKGGKITKEQIDELVKLLS
jgi:hypothetical protein